MPQWFGASRWVWLASLVLVTGCGAGSPDGAAETSPDPVSALDPVSQPTVDPVPQELPAVVARVNSQTITREELERAVRSAEIQAGQALPSQFRDQVYRSVLDRLVSFQLLLQESDAVGTSVDPAVLDERMETIRSGFQDTEAFENQLTSWETTLDVLREETKRDLLILGLLESQVPDVEVDDETARAFYDEHAEEFTERGGVKARHILLGLSPDAGEPEKTAARTRADDLRRQIADGADFAELARTHSEDPGSAANGGDLGTVVPGQTVPDFETALFALEPGDVSEVVETPFGVHVIQMTERQPARVVPFTEAAVHIREFVAQQEQQAKTEAFIEGLKTKSDIEILI
jgi:peptidyl-prolyl cis-trans isomerase C